MITIIVLTIKTDKRQNKRRKVMYRPSIVDYQVERLLKTMIVEEMKDEILTHPRMDMDAFWKHIAIARYINEVLGD